MMKLIYCTYCDDIVKLDWDVRRCKCGKSAGRYDTFYHASITSSAIPIGFASTGLNEALRNRPREGSGRVFEAFVIPCSCPTVKVDDDL